METPVNSSHAEFLGMETLRKLAIAKKYGMIEFKNRYLYELMMYDSFKRSFGANPVIESIH
jgi:hypothetical protein